MRGGKAGSPSLNQAPQKPGVIGGQDLLTPRLDRVRFSRYLFAPHERHARGGCPPDEPGDEPHVRD